MENRFAADHHPSTTTRRSAMTSKPGRSYNVRWVASLVIGIVESRGGKREGDGRWNDEAKKEPGPHEENSRRFTMSTTFATFFSILLPALVSRGTILNRCFFFDGKKLFPRVKLTLYTLCCFVKTNEKIQLSYRDIALFKYINTL